MVHICSKSVCVSFHPIGVWTKHTATPADTCEIQGRKIFRVKPGSSQGSSFVSGRVCNTNLLNQKIDSLLGKKSILNPGRSSRSLKRSYNKIKMLQLNFWQLQKDTFPLKNWKLSACEMDRIPQNVYKWINITSREWVREQRVCSTCVFCFSHWPPTVQKLFDCICLPEARKCTTFSIIRFQVCLWECT